jgi:hypothetical protein
VSAGLTYEPDREGGSRRESFPRQIISPSRRHHAVGPGLLHPAVIAVTTSHTRGIRELDAGFAPPGPRGAEDRVYEGGSREVQIPGAGLHPGSPVLHSSPAREVQIPGAIFR